MVKQEQEIQLGLIHLLIIFTIKIMKTIDGSLYLKININIAHLKIIKIIIPKIWKLKIPTVKHKNALVMSYKMITIVYFYKIHLDSVTREV